VEDSIETEAPARLTLLVQNELGYRNLTRLISRAYTEGQTRGQPVLKRAWVKEASAGLIALSGYDGDLGIALLGGKAARVQTAAEFWRDCFPNRFYIEIARCGRADDERHLRAAVAFARREGLPVVATNDVRFLRREDFEAHEARVCIAQGRVLDDARRPRAYTAEQYLKSADEMRALFADLPEAVDNAVEIARRCTLTLSFGKNHLPRFPVPDGRSEEEFLRERAVAGLERRLEVHKPVRPVEDYRSRLEYELKVIAQMGFAGYFLVVADFIEWAKTHGCPVGPGRGSGAGSLVAYAIGITDLDPLPYDLLFERFLNPERVSMPDFDVDFCMDNRDRVIDYVTHRYGRERVGQIITYATMAARGVVRDVTRVLGHPYGFGDRLAKLIPGLPGTTLADALDEMPELKQAYENEDDVRAVIDLGLALEGITRGVGVHAGGVVIAPQPLTDYAPLYCEAGGAGMRTQFDMKDLESVGLVKFDFLGLKTLTIVQAALEQIEAVRGQKIELLKLPLDDADTYKLFASGKTTAVFQMESGGMQRASVDLRPDCFEDIIALISLYRPGPMELIPNYVDRKHGREKIEYLHPAMERVLKPTFGIFVYQEQVMQTAQQLAGYTLGGADLLRRAMGKKKADEMAKQRAVFQEGAQKNGIEPATATQVFDLMEKFANYGFNKSHAAAYALVSYQTAWLKRHYPAEFMAAVLSCEMDHTETVVMMLDECRRMGLDVLAPNINQSRYRFTVVYGGKILYGLGAIRGVGEAALEGVLAERDAHGPFRDLFDFCRRIDLRKANKRVLEALINAGALDGFGLNRPSLLATLPKALQLAERTAADASAGIGDLFGLAPAAELGGDVTAVYEADWSSPEKLAREKETLGFYLSGHPIEAYRTVIDAVGSGSLKSLISQQTVPASYDSAGGGGDDDEGGGSGFGGGGGRRRPRRTPVVIGAWLADVRNVGGDRPGKLLTLDDRTAQVVCWIDFDAWMKYQNVLKKDTLVFANGELGISQREGREAEWRLYPREFQDLDGVLRDRIDRIVLNLGHPAPGAERLRACIDPIRAPNGAKVAVAYTNQAARGTLDLGPEWRVRPDWAGLERLRRLLGAEQVCVHYRKWQPQIARGEAAHAE
jgi:DNA polymerase-3 subunit alpha